MTGLRRTEAIRRDFISNVSHELRTPLAALKALAETLQDGASTTRLPHSTFWLRWKLRSTPSA
jgi:signal transduction histidine kinase